jgi:hypothetical protein
MKEYFMFVYSGIHNWQNEPAVKQILVFPDPVAKHLFESEFAARIEKEGISYASDSRIGAVYKLRAVKDDSGKYVPTIRGGDHAELLWTGEPLADPMVALGAAMAEMYFTVISFPKQDEVYGDKLFKTYSYIIDLVHNEINRLKVSESGNYEFEKPQVTVKAEAHAT